MLQHGGPPSGSKWSVWFCDACQHRVSTLNGSVGRCVIPIGRHSLMNGVGAPAREFDPTDEEERLAIVDAFHGDLMGLFDSMEHLQAFAQARRREFANELEFPSGEDIDLPVWLESMGVAATARSKFGDAASFEKLLDWFTRAGRRVGSANPRPEASPG